MNLEIQTTLKELLQKECWSTVAGKGTGSIFTIGLGRKVPRKKPLSNPHLTKEQKENRPEYGLMVYSSWELKREEDSICDSASDNSNDGPMVQGLALLRGKKVRETKFEDFKGGLSILFDQGYLLQINCDGEHHYKTDGDDFVIFTPSKNLSFTRDKRIEIEPIANAPSPELDVRRRKNENH